MTLREWMDEYILGYDYDYVVVVFDYRKEDYVYEGTIEGIPDEILDARFHSIELKLNLYSACFNVEM